jgi:hypothetical protein
VRRRTVGGRRLGAAATSDHCFANDAAALLATLLDVERRAMVTQEEKGWTADTEGHAPSSLHEPSSKALPRTSTSGQCSNTSMSFARTQA